MRTWPLLLLALLSLPPASLADNPALVIATDALQPQAAIDHEGAIYVVFLHKGNVAVAVSTDQGKSFGAPVVAIDVQGKARGGCQRGPRIGVDARKRITVTAPVTFDEVEYRQRYPTAEMYLVTSADGGRTWTRPLRVNEVPKMAPEALHWMAVAPTGEAHVAWLDMREGANRQDLFYARVIGGKVGKNVCLARDVCPCCAPGLAVDGQGNPFLAYREGGLKPSREVFARRSFDGGETFAAPVQLNRKPTLEESCPMSAPAVALSAEGTKYAAAWMDKRTGRGDRDVYWAISDQPAFTDDACVHGEAAGEQDHPALTIDAAGTVWTAWADKRGGRQRIWYRTTNGGEPGRPLSDEAEGQAGYPALASKGRLAAVVYETNEGGRQQVRFRLLTP